MRDYKDFSPFDWQVVLGQPFVTFKETYIEASLRVFGRYVSIDAIPWKDKGSLISHISSVEYARVFSSSKYTSNLESAVINYLRAIGIDAVKFRSGKYELDVYVPHKGVAFEFNGYSFHTSLFAPEFITEPKSKTYHKVKTDMALEDGIKLYHFWYNDSTELYDAIPFVENYLNISEMHLYYDCILTQPTKEELNIFYSENRTPPPDSNLDYVLTYHNKIVSAISVKYEGTKASIEAYCVKLGFYVMGGKEMLFNEVFKHDFTEITALVNRDLNPTFESSPFAKMGFTLKEDLGQELRYFVSKMKTTVPGNYFRDILSQMDNYNPKLSEQQILSSNGIYPIYNSGIWKAVLLK